MNHLHRTHSNGQQLPSKSKKREAGREGSSSDRVLEQWRVLGPHYEIEALNVELIGKHAGASH